MCDNSGTGYTIDLDDMDLDLGNPDFGGFIPLDAKNLDEQTKRELLISGSCTKLPAKLPAKCRWCKGTGKVKLLTSISDCDCVNPSIERIT